MEERERELVEEEVLSFFSQNGSIYGVRIFVFWTEVREKDGGKIVYNWADENRSF